MNNIICKGAVIPEKKRIVFLGDSITDDGTYIAHMNAYFYRHMPHKKPNFINLGLSSETASGLSEPDHPFPRPCIRERLDRALALSRPDWVVVCYGMNDGIYYPFSELRFNSYKKGILSLIEKIKAFGSRVIVMTPPPFDKASVINGSFLPEGMEKYSYMVPFEDYDHVLRKYGEWVLTELQEEVDQVIDLYGPLRRHIDQQRQLNARYVSGDGIHPNMEGHWIIAKTILNGLFNISLEQMPEYIANSEISYLFKPVIEQHKLLSAAWKEAVGHSNPNKAIAPPLDEAVKTAVGIEKEILGSFNERAISCIDNLSEWKGYKRLDFYFNGREGIIIEPEITAEGRPWIWRTEFFDAFPYADMEMVKRGWHLAYYRISDMYGCPEAVEMMCKFQNYIKETYGFAEKAVMFGFSRGGLYAFNYAAQYPENVAALYLDAPVLDICSWPGGKGTGIGSPKELQECLKIYGVDEKDVKSFKGSPVNRVAAVFKAGIPVIIVAGDADVVVPFCENAARLVEELKKLGANIMLIMKPGVGHHPHSLENPQEIVEFILNNAVYR